MDGRQSGCYAPDPGFPQAREEPGEAGLVPRPPEGPLTPTVADAAANPRRAAIALALALAPALAAVWTHPGFVTQDGPAHLYNAHVLLHASDPPFRRAFSVRREPLPNWAGHATLMGLAAAFPPRTADRLMTSLTLAGLAAATLWLRRRVSGGRGSPLASVLSALLALNVAWLLGFSGFLLGACLFPVTLGVWWPGRDAGFSARRAGALAGLTALGYFCHLVSLGLTAFGLVVLELFTPGGRRAARAAATGLGLLPLLPLGALYLALMRRGGRIAPEWKQLRDPFSPRAWFSQLAWVDPISLARKDALPLWEGAASPWFGLLAPVLWVAAGLTLACLATRPRRETRGWWVLAGALLAGGAAGPDTLGPSHGDYLQQRVVLLGLVALVPVLRLEATGRLGRASAFALAGALVVQSAFVWDYARVSERTAGAVLRAAGAVGTNRRVAALLIGIKTRFRANPLLHADCALGVGTGNVIWGNYETRFYYFPVRFRPGFDGPDPAELEAIALSDGPGQAQARARRWAGLLARHRGAIDALVVWGTDPALDALNAQTFRVVYEAGGLRVLLRIKSIAGFDRTLTSPGRPTQ